MASHTPLIAPCSVVIPSHLAEPLFAHLFPGDGDEHGAVLATGLAQTARGTRLLARELILATDGVDYVRGHRGYKMLRGEFVTAQALRCRDAHLGYLALHNHGGSGTVGFSPDDVASHARGYPALVQILRGQPVGALVFADGAAAGEIWWAPSARCQVAEVRILGPSIRRLHAGPAPTPRGRDETYDRQARLFGDAGQDLLRTLKVGIIGAGGVGALLVEYLAHLGIGWLVIADPDRLDITNLPRMPGATRWDARTWLTRAGRPAWLQRLGKRMAIPKARLAHRLARTAAPASRIDTLCGDITDGQVANHFIDCDYLFLAADTHQARLVFNALVHQFLIPGVQLGAKVPVEAATGAVGEPFSVYRPVTPSSGCLWCNGLISPERLQQEATTAQERVAQQYVPDEAVVAPSVITLNAVAASHAANDALFALTGLTRPEAHSDYVRLLHRSRDVRFDRPRRDLSCLECGIAAGSRFARGQGAQLPTRE